MADKVKKKNLGTLLKLYLQLWASVYV